MSRKVFSPLILFAAILALTILACVGSAPSSSSATQPVAMATQAPETIVTQLSPTGMSPTSIAPAIPERRFLALEFPPKIRAGDSDVVRLTLEMDDSGNITPTAVLDGNVVTGETIEIPNLYETHHVIAEARLDIAGIQVSPADLTSQTVEPGQSLTFFWSIRPEEVGVYKGTAWLFLRFVDKVSGEESRKAVSAQMVEIEAVNLFGVPAKVVRTVGGVGSVVGAVVGFPFFEDIVKLIFKRRPRRKK